MPALRGLAVHTWERTRLYIRKAGTVILGLTIVLWALRTWPGLPDEARRRYDQRRAALADPDPNVPRTDSADALAALDAEQQREQVRHSAIGRVGALLAPALRPCGLHDRTDEPDWKMPTALLGATAAKEVFISQVSILYAVEDSAGRESLSLRQRLARDYTPLQGVCIMLWILIASPCVATVVATWRESGAWRWAALQWIGLTALAWLVTAGLYQTARLLGAA